MAFRASQHGWPFGTVPTVEAHNLGLGAAPAADFGLDGGLCWTALDRYLRGVGIPRGTPPPEPGDPLHAELVRRQVEALGGVWAQVREWQESPDTSWRDRLPVRFSGGRDVASRTRGEWPAIRASLDKGRPVLLTVLFPADPYQRGRSARQLLATGWAMEGVRVVLSVYDPRRPGDDSVRLSFGPAGELAARLGSRTPVRGFFTVPYDRAIPGAARVETFGDRSVIGLNRKIRGRPAPSLARGRIDVVARNADGALLHFQRKRGQNWEGANITDQQELGSYELHSDPVAVRSNGLHAFARSYVGDLLHFHLGRSWKVENRTEHKRAGARFRLVGTPVPVAGPLGLVSVLGVDKDGGLVHYSGRPVLGWRAEQVAGEPLAGDPVAGRADGTLHVAGRGTNGRLLHWEHVDDRWIGTDLSAVPGAESSLIESRVVLRVEGETVYVAARTAGGRVVVLRKVGEGAWTAAEMGSGVVGDPVLTHGPAGVHLFARTEAGGVLHGWRESGWVEEDVLASRPSLGTVPASSTLACWGSDDELRVWVRGKDDLWALAWRSDADWTVERLSDRAGVAERHRAGEDPVVLEDRSGPPHLFFTDGRGTVLHLEPAEWQEPGASDSVAAPAEAPAVAGNAAATVTAVERGDAGDAGDAVDAVDVVDANDAAAAGEVVDARAAEGAEDDGAQPSAPSPEPWEVAATTEGDEAAVESDGPAVDRGGPAPDLPYLDFEADPPPRRAPVAAVDDGPERDGPERDGPERDAPERDEGQEPDAEPVEAPESKVDMDVESEPEPVPGADLEPMDLSLLNTWPPAPKSLRKRRKKRDPESS